MLENQSLRKCMPGLSYKLQPFQANAETFDVHGFISEQPPSRWWNYDLYRGPGGKKVEVLYSKTKEQSEMIAKQFVDEPILGFDMEWPWNDWKKDDLQNKVGLIQIASEAKIGLFHIGLHPGKTTDDIIAPTLRQIIESKSIGKVGVNILKADFGRLKRYFQISPQGAVESSHLYRLVKYGLWKPTVVSMRMVSLAKQVEDILKLPLWKGDVRTSNWSGALSKEQILYSASDAYAGYMLYACLNARRMNMYPTPPLPILHEDYPAGYTAIDAPILLEADDGTTLTPEEFFQPKSAEARPEVQTLSNHLKVGEPRIELDHVSQALYHDLVVRRNVLAKSAGYKAFQILSNRLLESLARLRPRTSKQLLAIKGIGKIQEQRYGAAWLEVISLFMIRNGIGQPIETGIEDSVQKNSVVLEATSVNLATTPRRKRLLASDNAVAHEPSPDSSPAFETPPQRTAHLHTGLSFCLAETNLEDITASKGVDCSYDSDNSLLSLDLEGKLRGAGVSLKRKRCGSVNSREIHTASQQSPALHSICENMRNAPPKPAVSVGGEQRQGSVVRDEEVPVCTPRSKLARNKLIAFSKLVGRKLDMRALDAPPLVTEHTLALLVKHRPQTSEELKRIPGIGSLVLACRQTNTDLLKNVIKFVPPR